MGVVNNRINVDVYAAYQFMQNNDQVKIIIRILIVFGVVPNTLYTSKLNNINKISPICLYTFCSFFIALANKNIMTATKRYAINVANQTYSWYTRKILCQDEIGCESGIIQITES